MKILKRKISNSDGVICIEVIQELLTYDKQQKMFFSEFGGSYWAAKYLEASKPIKDDGATSF